MGSSLSNIFRILSILFQKLAKSVARAVATLLRVVVLPGESPGYGALYSSMFLAANAFQSPMQCQPLQTGNFPLRAHFSQPSQQGSIPGSGGGPSPQFRSWSLNQEMKSNRVSKTCARSINTTRRVECPLIQNHALSSWLITDHSSSQTPSPSSGNSAMPSCNAATSPKDKTGPMIGAFSHRLPSDRVMPWR